MEQDGFPVGHGLRAELRLLPRRRADRLHMIGDHCRPAAQPVHGGGRKAEGQRAAGKNLTIETGAAAEDVDIRHARQRRIGWRPEQALGQPEQSGEIIVRQVGIGDRNLAIRFPGADEANDPAHQVKRCAAVGGTEIGHCKRHSSGERLHGGDSLGDKIAGTIDHCLGSDRVGRVVARPAHRDHRHRGLDVHALALSGLAELSIITARAPLLVKPCHSSSVLLPPAPVARELSEAGT